MARVALHTLGCKLNFAETATIAQALSRAGHTITDWDTPADIYILNTCTVTHQAERKAHKLLRQAMRQAPQAAILVTGCYAQVNPAAFESYSTVQAIVPNKEKFTIAQRVQQILGQAAPPAPQVTDWTFFHSTSGEGRTRAFLKVQDGCDYKCSFCLVPQARGPSRSAAPELILQEARRLAESGFLEIVLTGINLGDYGKPHGYSFLELLRQLEAQLPPTVRRLRLSSIEPNLLSDAILDFIADHPRWAPHFHLPLQSASDEILAKMRRRYRRRHYEKRIGSIRQRFPRAGIGVDVIVGFPGETKVHFDETRRFLADLPISYLHVFPYSERPGTLAATYPDQVPWPERLERSGILRELSLRKKAAFAESCRGLTLHLLLETAYEGLTENYLRLTLVEGTDATYIPAQVDTVYIGEDEVQITAQPLAFA